MKRVGLFWKSLEQKLNLKQIAEKLQQEFDVDLNKAEQCVINLLDDLQSEKLVEILSGEK